MTADVALAALLDTAAARVLAGGAVAYPTETLYGLGADAASETAVERLLSWKGRAASQPLTVLVAEPAALAALGITLPALAHALVDAFWPGPLTLVLPARGRFATGVARADGAVGVRCSSHPVAAALAARLAREGVVITSTSLNRTGAPPARTHAEARARLGAGADEPLLVGDDTAPEPSGVASTVLDVTSNVPRLLRSGAVAREALERVTGRLLPQEAEATA
jgi:L-threonylcarbamoyladenylate synthase